MMSLEANRAATNLGQHLQHCQQGCAWGAITCPQGVALKDALMAELADD